LRANWQKIRITIADLYIYALILNWAWLSSVFTTPSGKAAAARALPAVGNVHLKVFLFAWSVPVATA
jgi:hypothetical protein